MMPTELALSLKPELRAILFQIETLIQPEHEFDLNSARVFRIMPSLVRTSSGSSNRLRRRLRPLLIAGWVMPR